VFSHCKTACFQDILYPSKFHFNEWKYREGKKRTELANTIEDTFDDYHSGDWQGEMDGEYLETEEYPNWALEQDEIEWEEKANALFWRGSISGMFCFFHFNLHFNLLHYFTLHFIYLFFIYFILLFY
jgi:hypothetical protein